MFDIQEELKKLPQKPGVYLMKNDMGKIIYVGKAINLKNRVRQYFQASSQQDHKVAVMSPLIKEFEYIVVDNELEALILECNLIKKYWPKYNIRLKDDKSYPYLKLTTSESFPRLYMTRKHDKDKAKYFGPYVNATALKETVELIHRIWPIKRCLMVLPRDEGKNRPCLNFHIGQCKAPCNKLISKEEYGAIINEVVKFINGKHDDVVRRLEGEMKKYAEEMEFEKAAETRDLIEAVKKLGQEQKVDSGTMHDQDVVAFALTDNEALAQVFFIRGGKMTGREKFIMTGVENMTKQDIMTEFIKQFYSETTLIPKELVLESDINDRDIIQERLCRLKGQSVTITVPQRGDKLSLVKMAATNAELELAQFGEQIKKEQRKTTGAMSEIKEALGIEKEISRIEAYDISNVAGYESVGSMAVFENGKAKYSDYRKFKIKGVLGPNDYASMQEVLTRRFTRYKTEAAQQEQNGIGKFNTLPDVIFVDGGKGHVSSAEKVLLEMELSIPVCGMVKDDRHRTRALLYMDREVVLPKNSEGFRLVTRIQDEVHRFAIEYHRKLREKAQVKSVLDGISSIGPARRKALLKHFGSIEKIMNSSVEELQVVETMNKKSAEEVYNFFNK